MLLHNKFYNSFTVKIKEGQADFVTELKIYDSPKPVLCIDCDYFLLIIIVKIIKGLLDQENYFKKRTLDCRLGATRLIVI